MKNIQEKLGKLLEVVREADVAVLRVYNESEDIEFATKADDSPVTEADIASHTILMNGISKIFPKIPIVSEEGNDTYNRWAVSSEEFWLVDPLDGTNEFIKRSGHFTICAALVENDLPSFGIVSAPAMGLTYYGGHEFGSFLHNWDIGSQAEPIHTKHNDPGIVLRSRSSLDSSTKAYIEQNYPNFDISSVGSQLKLPVIAEGRADVYPRLESPLHLWDLAAGHAILAASGGSVTRLDGSPIDYHSKDLMAGDFIAKNY